MREGNPRITKPRIIGHEISGEIVDIGEGVIDFSIGDRVSTGADIPCGECLFCKSGAPNCCDINYAIGYQFDGGFAEYVLLDPLAVKYGPVRKFNDTLSWKEAALAEPLACCINGYERALYTGKNPGTVVIFGAGPIGLMLMMLGRQLYGVETIVIVEPSRNRRELASQLGADLTIDPEKTNPVATIMDLTDGRGAKTIFTACPVIKTHQQAIDMVAKRGVVNLFGGVPKTEPPIPVLSNLLHYREAYVTGSHGSTPEQHAKALDLLVSGSVDVSNLISKVVTLDNIHDGIAVAETSTVAKVVVTPDKTF
jgi:L-iditol 2-dehydrogenase